MMIWFVVLQVAAVTVGLVDGTLPIIGGVDPAESELGFVGSLQFGVGHYCSAVLVNGGEYVLTAASCVADGLGGKVVFRNGVERDVTEISIHNAFKQKFIQYDVALLKLDAKITEISSVLLFDGDWDSIDTIELAGFGATNKENTVESPPKLLVARDIPVVRSREDCAQGLGVDFLTNSHFCAGFGIEIDRGLTCIGDEGGPAVIDPQNNGVKYLVGLIGSWDCARATNNYSILLNISKAIQWIESNGELGDEDLVTPSPTSVDSGTSLGSRCPDGKTTILSLNNSDDSWQSLEWTASEDADPQRRVTVCWIIEAAKERFNEVNVVFESMNAGYSDRVYIYQLSNRSDLGELLDFAYQNTVPRGQIDTGSERILVLLHSYYRQAKSHFKLFYRQTNQMLMTTPSPTYWPELDSYCDTMMDQVIAEDEWNVIDFDFRDNEEEKTYQPDQDLCWIVLANTRLQFRMDFLDTGRLTGDFVRISSFVASSPQYLANVKYWSGTKYNDEVVTMFQNRDGLVQFHSDSQFEYKGFRLSYRNYQPPTQAPTTTPTVFINDGWPTPPTAAPMLVPLDLCPNGTKLVAIRNDVEDWSYLEDGFAPFYENNLDLCWLLESKTFIEWYMKATDLEYNYDRVSVYELNVTTGKTDLKRQFSFGSSTYSDSYTYISEGPHLLIHFHTDSTINQYAGFKLAYRRHVVGPTAYPTPSPTISPYCDTYYEELEASTSFQTVSFNASTTQRHEKCWDIEIPSALRDEYEMEFSVNVLNVSLSYTYLVVYEEDPSQRPGYFGSSIFTYYAQNVPTKVVYSNGPSILVRYIQPASYLSAKYNLVSFRFRLVKKRDPIPILSTLCPESQSVIQRFYGKLQYEEFVFRNRPDDLNNGTTVMCYLFSPPGSTDGVQMQLLTTSTVREENAVLVYSLRSSGTVALLLSKIFGRRIDLDRKYAAWGPGVHYLITVNNTSPFQIFGIYGEIFDRHFTSRPTVTKTPNVFFSRSPTSSPTTQPTNTQKSTASTTMIMISNLFTAWLLLCVPT